jgi:pimeloyl-ACP methyl ester carboxylesterase
MRQKTRWSLLWTAIAVALVLAASPTIQRQAYGGGEQFTPLSVKTPDGLTIRAQVWGNASGPEILFIHGFSQSYLSWIMQTGSDLPKTFRIVTYDLRGHGGSDKPLDTKYYQNDKAWADEVAAVIQAANLKRPVVVAWSYGGRVIGNYLRYYGDGHLAGLNLVDIRAKTDPAWDGEVTRKIAAAMISDDVAMNVAGTSEFVRGVTAAPLSPKDFQLALAYNMVVPVGVRAALRGGGNSSVDYTAEFRKLKIPVLVTHGTKDDLIKIEAARYTASVVPGAKLSIYENVGHAAFLEQPERFNKELAEFAMKATGKNP